MIPRAQESVEIQQETPLFVCAECGEPVIVFGGESFRTCEHREAAINVTKDGLLAVSDGV